MSLERQLQDLADKQAIYEVVARYCRGVDRLDLELVRSCYHPDAREHHPGFDGGRDDYIAWIGQGLVRFEGTMHVIANHLVEIDGDLARAETYVNAYHWSTDGTYYASDRILVKHDENYKTAHPDRLSQAGATQ